MKCKFLIASSVLLFVSSSFSMERERPLDLDESLDMVSDYRTCQLFLESLHKNDRYRAAFAALNEYESRADIRGKLKAEISRLVLMNLIKKVQRVDENTINQYLYALHGVNWQNNDGNTALMLACQLGHAKIVDYLLLIGADVTMRNREGYTALRLAVRYGHLQALNTLVGFVDSNHDGIFYADFINEFDQETGGPNALMTAYRYNHPELMSVLLDAGTDIDHKSFELEGTLLDLAIAADDLPTVKWLVAQGADIQEDESLEYLWGPLEGALSHKRFAILEYLIGEGAVSNLIDQRGFNFLMRVIVKDLRYNIREVKEQKLLVIRLLIARGADVHYINADGESALSQAIKLKDVDLVALLFESGLDLQRVNADYCYRLARASRRTEIIRMVENAGGFDSKRTHDVEVKEKRSSKKRK